MGEHTFYFKGDKKADTIEEFAEVLKTMTQEEFDHHVTTEKNDFATWIGQSLNNKELSDKLKNCKTINDTIKTITPKDTVKAITSKKEKPAIVNKEVKKPETKSEDKEHDTLIQEVMESKIHKELEPPKMKVFGGENHSLVIREFIFGILFGLFLGLILMAVLVRLGIYY